MQTSKRTPLALLSGSALPTPPPSPLPPVGPLVSAALSGAQADSAAEELSSCDGKSAASSAPGCAEASQDFSSSAAILAESLFHAPLSPGSAAKREALWDLIPLGGGLARRLSEEAKSCCPLGPAAPEAHGPYEPASRLRCSFDFGEGAAEAGVEQRWTAGPRRAEAETRGPPAAAHQSAFAFGTRTRPTTTRRRRARAAARAAEEEEAAEEAAEAAAAAGGAAAAGRPLGRQGLTSDQPPPKASRSGRRLYPTHAFQAGAPAAARAPSPAAEPAPSPVRAPKRRHEPVVHSAEEAEAVTAAYQLWLSAPQNKKACAGAFSERRCAHARPQRKGCAACGCMKTAQWRTGPRGPGTLCNACGVKWRSCELQYKAARAWGEGRAASQAGAAAAA